MLLLIVAESAAAAAAGCGLPLEEYAVAAALLAKVVILGIGGRTSLCPPGLVIIFLLPAMPLDQFGGLRSS